MFVRQGARRNDLGGHFTTVVGKHVHETGYRARQHEKAPVVRKQPNEIADQTGYFSLVCDQPRSRFPGLLRKKPDW